MGQYGDKALSSFLQKNGPPFREAQQITSSLIRIFQPWQPGDGLALLVTGQVVIIVGGHLDRLPV